FFFFSSRRRHTRSYGDWSSDVCSSDLDFMEEQLDAIPELRFKPMFGGFGIYSDAVFFGLISGERLFLRTTERTVTRFEKAGMTRSEEHTSELQSPYDLVCRLLLEKKKL